MNNNDDFNDLFQTEYHKTNGVDFEKNTVSSTSETVHSSNLDKKDDLDKNQEKKDNGNDDEVDDKTLFNCFIGLISQS